MEWYYSEEKNVQILLSLLKEFGIKRIIASPGSTNACLVASMQSDDYFEMYSCVDERSAGYMACGMAEETNEPVVLSCTGATASRNYMPALTEAFYRRLPVIAITSSQMNEKIGHLIPQVTDRTHLPNDVTFLSVQVPPIKMAEEEWNCTNQLCKALTECTRHGGGPVHINLQTRYSRNFNVKNLPTVKPIRRICYRDKFPSIADGKIVIFVGSHRKFTQMETDSIDRFCECNNAVVFYEMSSGYHGKYGIKYDLIAAQEYSDSPLKHIDLLIQIGELAGDDFFLQLYPKFVWRVSQDGDIKDTFKKLEYVFEMDEVTFFQHYIPNEKKEKNHTLYDSYKSLLKNLESLLYNAELPFSNIWIATRCINKLPKGSEIHVGIMNSFRAWNLLELPQEVDSYCNVGGYGIDGCISSMIGASLVHHEKLYFGVFGDLAFFYDMNILGNRHLGNNIRIMLINNGKGNEFHNHVQNWAQFGEAADVYGAAGGHFSCKSPTLVRHYCSDLGFKYISASNKEEFLHQIDIFMNPELTECPIFFEVFTDGDNEAKAYRIMRQLITEVGKELKGKLKNSIRRTIGDNKARLFSELLNK